MTPVKKILLRWIVNFLGLWLAASLLGGVSYNEHWPVLVWAALIFSIVNGLIRPLIILLTLPAIVLTLGMFTFVINAFMLYLVTIVYPKFQLASIWSALAAAAIIWAVNYLVNDWLQERAA